MCECVSIIRCVPTTCQNPNMSTEIKRRKLRVQLSGNYRKTLKGRRNLLRRTEELRLQPSMVCVCVCVYRCVCTCVRVVETVRPINKCKVIY